ncbi:MAG: hypothetical protein ACTSUE_05660 [Promethearchaeota archaeon]
MPPKDIEFEQSPNFSSRNGSPIKLIVVHWMDGSFLQGIMHLMLESSCVLSHYAIS